MGRATVSLRARIALVLATVAGCICTATGIYAVWAQNTGELAAVTVVECHYAGRGQTCTGTWHDGTSSRTVHIVAAETPTVGTVVGMRIHGEKAYSTSPMLPTVLIGAGAVLLGGAVLSVVIVRRRDSTEGSAPDR